MVLLGEYYEIWFDFCMKKVSKEATPENMQVRDIENKWGMIYERKDIYGHADGQNNLEIIIAGCST